MWLIGAFISATFLGFYDVFKKKALINNAVLPVLFLNTFFSSLIFLPFIILSSHTHCLDNSFFYVEQGGWYEHQYIILKSVIVLSSWIFGYISMKHLPLTMVGPINATRPIMVLVGAMCVYGEHLNMYQWIGVVLALLSLFLLSISGKKEGIHFTHNKWIFFLFIAAILGAISGLYDKFLMASPANGGVGLNKMLVQSWFNIYQCLWMGLILAFLWLPTRHTTTPFKWNYYIIGITFFLCLADLLYFYALSLDGAMISVISMIRRGSVIVSFSFGAFIFREKNLKNKAIDLILVVLGMIFLYWGSH